MASRPIAVVGAGGHGKVVMDALLTSGVELSAVIGFVDPDPKYAGVTILGFPVLPNLTALGPDRGGIVIGIGDNAVRRRLFDEALAAGYEPITVVHRSAVVARSSLIGRGTVIFAHVVVNPDTWIGDNVILNTGCSVDHDCHVAAHAHLAPGVRVAGGVTIGEEALLGVASAVTPGGSVGARSIVGAGAVVLDAVPANAISVGMPARVIKWRT